MIIFCLKALQWRASHGPAAFLLQSTFVMIRLTLIKEKTCRVSLSNKTPLASTKLVHPAVDQKGSARHPTCRPTLFVPWFPHLQESKISAVFKDRGILLDKMMYG